jgi:branched-chain amino acid transport system substrate-binding protein
LLQDGKKNVAIVYVDNSYGNGLKKVTAGIVTKGGAKVKTYAFAENETNFASIVDKVVATKPDAVAIISYDEAKKAIPAFKAKKFNGSNFYLVDGNLADYSKTSFASYLKGSKGTLPGKATAASFKNKLAAAYKAVENKDLTEFSYGAETYDAVILVALAAQAAGKASGEAIKSELTNVSLAGKGKSTVTSFAAGLAAIKAGKKVNFDGFSGPIEFDSNGDPTGAYIGIYKYDAKGKYNLVRTVAGNTVK